MNSNDAIIEGLLFVVGDDGMTLDQIMNITELTQEKAIESLSNLKKYYDENNRGIRVLFLGNTFKLTREEHRKYYQKIIEETNNNIFSQAALEVLAIIAYNEPITRVEIDQNRGISSVHIVRKLLSKGLIKEAGKSDLPGKPNLYKTTDDFLNYFGINNIKELPKLEEIAVEDEEQDLYKTRYKEETSL